MPRTLQQFPEDFWSGRATALRVDWNVPLRDGIIQDDTRIRASLPTLTYLLERGARVLVMSHLGRPKGKVNPAYSLRPLVSHVERLLNRPVRFVPEHREELMDALWAELGPGEVALLENVRFHPGERNNDPAFAALLARGVEAYVNDAFGTAHRAHASVEALPRRIAHKAMGRLFEREIFWLRKVREAPDAPFVVVLGGAKVSDKLGVIRHLLSRVDRLVVGGGMAYTFLAARGEAVGRSLVDEEHLEDVRAFLGEAPEKFVLPVDHVVAASPEAGHGEVVQRIPSDRMGLDIGPETRARFQAVIEGRGTIFWNGPMGVFENPAFREGTRVVAERMVAACAEGATVVVGGGDTASAYHLLGFPTDAVSHVSTGGGATLTYVAGEPLPALEALE